MLKVLVVGQTPPPYGGSPIMVERLLKSKMPGVKLIHVRVGFVSHIKDHGKVNLWKILHVFTLIARIIYHRIVDRPQILYYLPAGPNRVTLLRDIPILISTRWLFEKTVFHYQLAGISELCERLSVWQRWLYRRAYFGADAAIRLCEDTPEDGKLLAAKREYVIPNAIEDPCLDRSIARRDLAPDSDDALRILFVGMLRESKGVMVLIEACAKLAARGVPFHVEVMGQWKSEEFAARVKQRIEQLGLGKHVRFLGVMIGEEKFAAYRRADVFCFPTFFNSEAMPVVLVEAMASGLPVVATRWRGIPSVVVEGETGLLVEPHDPDAVADRLAVLAEDIHLRERMGHSARDRFERKYTQARFAAAMRRVFLETAEIPVDEAVEAQIESSITLQDETAVEGATESREEVATA
jgi:glycosyltransferase involved in cell wall biosynthesis